MGVQSPCTLASVYTGPLRAHFTDENQYRGVSDEPT